MRNTLLLALLSCSTIAYAKPPSTRAVVAYASGAIAKGKGTTPTDAQYDAFVTAVNSKHIRQVNYGKPFTEDYGVTVYLPKGNATNAVKGLPADQIMVFTRQEEAPDIYTLLPIAKAWQKK